MRPPQDTATPTDGTTAPAADRVDVRGPRFGATITMVALATAIIVQGPVGLALVGYTVVQFVTASFFGLQASPNARLFRMAKARFDLGPPTETEPVGPPRFAQMCGLAVAGPGLVALMLGASGVGWTLVSVVLALSSLLALTGLCVGCELYIVGQRLRARNA